MRRSLSTTTRPSHRLSRSNERTRSNDPVTEVLAVRLGDDHYGVPVATIREIVRHAQITLLPRSPAHVLGVMTVRGRVVTVVSTSTLLNLPGPTRHPKERILVVEVKQEPVGFLVDEVLVVHRLTEQEIERANISSSETSYIEGVARPQNTDDGGGEIVVLLNLPALLPV